MHMDEQQRERRRLGRVRKTILARCEIFGKTYQARTFDINQMGLALTTNEAIPEAKEYSVTLALPSGTEAKFRVSECQRRLIRHQGQDFLRISLNIISESMDTHGFFTELAALFLEKTEIAEDSEATD